MYHTESRASQYFTTTQTYYSGGLVYERPQLHMQASKNISSKALNTESDPILVRASKQ